jgi:hypothetical protein
MDEALLERLAILVEECSEVQQIVAKILRHGIDSRHPKTLQTNTELLEEEVAHVVHAIQLLFRAGDINACAVEEFKKARSTTILKYIHHNKELASKV